MPGVNIQTSNKSSLSDSRMPVTKHRWHSAYGTQTLYIVLLMNRAALSIAENVYLKRYMWKKKWQWILGKISDWRKANRVSIPAWSISHIWWVMIQRNSLSVDWILSWGIYRLTHKLKINSSSHELSISAIHWIICKKYSVKNSFTNHENDNGSGVRYQTAEKSAGFISQLEASCMSSHTEELWSNETVCLWIIMYIYIYIYICIKVKLATIVEDDQKACFSIATTPRCRGGRYSFPWIAPLYPRYIPYIAEC